MAFRMPGEFEPHERTLMAWPVHPSWGEHLEAARSAYAELAAAIAAFEPLTMLVNPGDARFLYDTVSSDDKTLKIYEGLYHEVHNEPERATVLRDMGAWLEARV